MLMAEALKNGPVIPQITFFGCEIVFSSIPSIVSLIQMLPISCSRFKHFQFHVVDYPPPPPRNSKFD